MSILFPRYKMQSYRYSDGLKWLTERSDDLDAFEDYKGKSEYCIEIKEGKKIVYTEFPETIDACEQKVDDAIRLCRGEVISIDEAVSGLNSLKDMPEYPDFPPHRFGEGEEDYILRRQNHYDKRLTLYSDLLVAKDRCMQLDEAFINDGNTESFKDNRKLMAAYDRAIDNWKEYLGKVFKSKDIAKAEEKANEMCGVTVQEQEVDAELGI